VFDWDDGNKTAPHVWVDMQLPLYFRAAESGKLADVIPTGARVECGYFVLGPTRENCFCETRDFYRVREAIDAAVRWIVGRVRAGIFWPPRGLGEDFAGMFPGVSEDEIESGISGEWVADQRRRLVAWEAQGKETAK
ncbi:MAG: hypothetical protein LBM92_07675, partial [Opitutaceae bacterium]|jgi:hypothetical protein|nr:hypothetical protein [Opitutaceae bacterium]